MNIFLCGICFPPFFHPSLLSSLMCFYTLFYPPVFICPSFIHLIFPDIHAFWSLSIPPILSTSPSSHSFLWLPHHALPPLFVLWLLRATSSLQMQLLALGMGWERRVPTRIWVHIGCVWVTPEWVCTLHLQSPLNSRHIVIDHVFNDLVLSCRRI